MPSLLTIFLISLTLTFRLGRCSDRSDLLPTTLQIDLVYPRANETHLRTWPFPIVFAIRGYKTVWPYNLVLFWELYDIDQFRSGIKGTPDGDSGRFENLPGKPRDQSYTTGEAPDGEDPYYYISRTNRISQFTGTNFFIRYEFYFLTNCTEGDSSLAEDPSTSPPYHDGKSPRIRGFVPFSVSSNVSLNINMGGDDPCLNPESTFIDGVPNTLRIAGPSSPGGCMYFDDENLRPRPDKCTTVHPDLEEMVSQAMLASIGCGSDIKWPDDVSKRCDVYDSPPDREGSGAGSSSSLLVISLLVVSSVFLVVL